MSVHCIKLNFALNNYDDLRDPLVHIPRILVVVTVPGSVSEWLNHSEAQLSLKHCGYWLFLAGRTDVPSAASDPRVTVHLPRSQPFNVEQLQAMMSRISAGGLP